MPEGETQIEKDKGGSTSWPAACQTEGSDWILLPKSTVALILNLRLHRQLSGALVASPPSRPFRLRGCEDLAGHIPPLLHGPWLISLSPAHNTLISPLLDFPQLPYLSVPSPFCWDTTWYTPQPIVLRFWESSSHPRAWNDSVHQILLLICVLSQTDKLHQQTLNCAPWALDAQDQIWAELPLFFILIDSRSPQFSHCPKIHLRILLVPGSALAKLLVYKGQKVPLNNLSKSNDFLGGNW